MVKTINDPVFGELKYNKDGYWNKSIFLDIWGGEDEQLDLVVKTKNGENISDCQRNAYKSYLTDLQKIAKEVPAIILSYYKDHYE
ncbi:MAG: hypothetical protein MJZ33_12660, partial [Paludibacteraceae bacterium]|nr:hypothetical protein [Paludibacteraceae bacterium]